MSWCFIGTRSVALKFTYHMRIDDIALRQAGKASHSTTEPDLAGILNRAAGEKMGNAKQTIPFQVDYHHGQFVPRPAQSARTRHFLVAIGNALAQNC